MRPVAVFGKVQLWCQSINKEYYEHQIRQQEWPATKAKPFVIASVFIPLSSIKSVMMTEFWENTDGKHSKTFYVPKTSMRNTWL